jgi:hypothetical protein
MPAYHISYLSNLVEDFNIGGNSFMERLSEVADGKSSVSMLNEFNHVTLDIISKVSMADYTRI